MASQRGAPTAPTPGATSAGDAPYPSWTKGKSTIVMVEPVTANHAIGVGGHASGGANASTMDIQPLLRLMDICTCASAEKHTGVNCVTASCGDIVFEYVPRCGELLELTATPVYTAGRTSLDVGLNVVAEGDGGVRRFVCYASFTYVTTRDKNGNKVMCPPIGGGDVSATGDERGEKCNADDVPESARWERTVAYYRRALLKAETKRSSNDDIARIDDTAAATYGFDLEFTEVVLPAHLNHMQHTFGGIVMGWMCKAALAEASRKSKRAVGTLRIRSVTRVEFASGSDVSNHLVFRPRLNAAFDGARSAEVEVRVSRRSIETGQETHMNTGYFYVSGENSDAVFSSSMDFCSGLIDDTAVRDGVRADATWRRRLVLARRRLLGGLGEAIEWHPALQDVAPLLTILAVLRLVNHDDSSTEWKRLLGDDENGRMTRLGQYVLGSTRVTDFRIEVTRCQWLGSKNTFILRAKGKILNASVKTLFRLIKDRRPEWDEICSSVNRIEKKEKNSPSGAAGNEDEICWDIVQHTAVRPAKAMLAGYLACLCAGTLPRRKIPLCLLRAWRTSASDDGNGDAVYASRSVRHPEAGEDSLTEVLPSGWFLSPSRDVDGNLAGTSVTYVVEHDLAFLRRLVPMFTDESIIDLMARTVEKWFWTFGSMAEEAEASGRGAIL